MKIIYHCYGGTHSSVTAAGIHLGLLPRDRLPKYQELLSLELFDRQNGCDIGRIKRLGQDDSGHEVYVVGRRSRPQLLYHVAQSLTDLFDLNRDQMMFVDVSSYVNSSMRAGGFMSRRIGLVQLGRPIVTWGTLRNYKKIVDVVEKVLSEIKQKNNSQDHEIIKIRNPEVAC